MKVQVFGNFELSPMLIACAQKPPLITYADISSRARDLNFDLSLHLHSCFVNVSSKDPDERICTCSPEPLLLNNCLVFNSHMSANLFIWQDKGVIT